MRTLAAFETLAAKGFPITEIGYRFLAADTPGTTVVEKVGGAFREGSLWGWLFFRCGGGICE